MLVGPDIIVVIFVGLMVLLPLLAVVDAASRPSWFWASAGQSKALWILLPLAGIVIPFGFILAIVYYTVVRPKLLAVERYGIRSPAEWSTWPAPPDPERPGG